MFGQFGTSGAGAERPTNSSPFRRGKEMLTCYVAGFGHLTSPSNLRGLIQPCLVRFLCFGWPVSGLLWIVGALRPRSPIIVKSELSPSKSLKEMTRQTLIGRDNAALRFDQVPHDTRSGHVPTSPVQPPLLPWGTRCIEPSTLPTKGNKRERERGRGDPILPSWTAAARVVNSFAHQRSAGIGGRIRKLLTFIQRKAAVEEATSGWSKSLMALSKKGGESTRHPRERSPDSTLSLVTLENTRQESEPERRRSLPTFHGKLLNEASSRRSKSRRGFCWFRQTWNPKPTPSSNVSLHLPSASPSTGAPGPFLTRQRHRGRNRDSSSVLWKV